LVLRPIGTLSMMGLMLHGAMGRLGEAAGVDRFEFDHLVVRPTLAQGRRGVKVAFDGEVAMMRAPLDIRVLAKPLYLLRPQQLTQQMTQQKVPPKAAALDAASPTDGASL